MANQTEYEVVRRRPDTRLQPHLDGDYQAYVEGVAAGDREVRTPSGMVTVILGFGSGMLHLDGERPPEAHTAFVAGLHESYTVTESLGPSYGVQVNFTPIGAYLVFGQPMHRLVNRVVELADVFGSAARVLMERLGEASEGEPRFRLIDSFIAARLATARPASPAVAWAWSELARSSGQVRIGALAEQIGWSRKHLVAQFREQIGLPPKSVARLLRFRRVTSLLNDEVRWVQIAQDCGYYDQAHFIRDFRQFSGSTPGEFVRQRNGD